MTCPPIEFTSPGEKLRAALPITQLIFEVLNSFMRQDSFSVYGSPGFYPNKLFIEVSSSPKQMDLVINKSRNTE